MNEQSEEELGYETQSLNHEAQREQIIADLQEDIKRRQAEHDYLENKIKRLKDLLKHAKCPNCDGSGVIPHQIASREYVTRDMALDAGQPELEGSLYQDEQWEPEQCQWCYEKEQVLS